MPTPKAVNQHMAQLAEDNKEWRLQNQQLFDLLQKIVNGATRTMGTDSCGYEYAHIRQDILDLGRAVLREAERPVNTR